MKDSSWYIYIYMALVKDVIVQRISVDSDFYSKLCDQLVLENKAAKGGYKQLAKIADINRRKHDCVE